MSETNKFYQYDRNDNNTFGVRGTASGGGTTVIANETLAGTEDSLTELTVGETKYKVFDIPTVTIAVSQVIGQNPLTIQLTNDQYNVFANSKQVLIDLSALGEIVVIWNYYGEDSDWISYGFADYTLSADAHQIYILKETKIATYYYNEKNIVPIQVGSGNTADVGKLLAMNDSGEGILTKNLPVLTTAPTAANTEGGLILVVLASEPATYYNGYYYIIAPST